MSEWKETAVAGLSIAETDKESVTESAGDAKPAEEDQAKARAETAATMKARGWVEPSKYDYELYTSKGSHDKEAGVTQANETSAGQDPAAEKRREPDEPVWAGTAVKYEWKDEFGEVGPPIPELEEILFNDENVNRRGERFAALQIPVSVESEIQIRPVKKFEDAGLHPVMLQNVKLCQYDTPTPIQAYCIPAILSNRDVIAVAQTGSGKTAAYMIPILSKLMGKAKKLAAPRPNPTEGFDWKIHGVRAEPLVLIIVPTRELAVQIFDDARRLCYRSMLRPCVAYGGAPARDQADELRRGCDILIGTPGRLIDFIGRGSLMSLRRIRYTVIDEADELVGPDWIDDMRQIMSGGDNNEDGDHRYMLFSATFPKGARELAREYLDDSHIRVRVGRVGSTHANIHQNVILCEEANKRSVLKELLISAPPSRTIIFVNSKKSADFLDDYLYNNGMPSTSIHSDRTQREREDAIRAFKSGKAPILVTTGVSARGLDLVNVMHVVNYDLPSCDHGGIVEYVHRIGRTARIGQTGIATSFYNERNEDIAPMLVKLLIESNMPIPDALKPFVPEEDGPIDFEDDTDEEEAGETGGGFASGDGDRTEHDGASSVQQPTEDASSWGNQQPEQAAADTWAAAPQAEAPEVVW